MPKHIIEFDMPEEREEMEDALNGWDYKYQLEEMWNLLFRPYYKHGYDDEKMNQLLNSKNGRYIMDYLEKKFKDIRRWND